MCAVGHRPQSQKADILPLCSLVPGFGGPFAFPFHCDSMAAYPAPDIRFPPSYQHHITPQQLHSTRASPVQHFGLPMPPTRPPPPTAAGFAGPVQHFSPPPPPPPQPPPAASQPPGTAQQVGPPLPPPSSTGRAATPAAPRKSTLLVQPLKMKPQYLPCSARDLQALNTFAPINVCYCLAQKLDEEQLFQSLVHTLATHVQCLGSCVLIGDTYHLKTPNNDISLRTVQVFPLRLTVRCCWNF